MTDSIKKIDEIVASSSSQFDKLNGGWTTNDPKSLNSQLDSFYSKYQNSQLISPNPLTPSNKLTPIYISVSCKNNIIWVLTTIIVIIYNNLTFNLEFGSTYNDRENT